MRRDLLLIFVFALIIRLLAALPQQQPNYMDAAYYYVTALNLAQGRGLVEDFVWNYLDNPSPPPRPSHLYWMPLTSMMAWLGMAVGGVSYRVAQIPFVVISALLAPITYWITRAVSGKRWQGWLAALLAIFSGFYFPYWTAIDNFTPFAVAGSLALIFAANQQISESVHNSQFTIHNSQLILFSAGLFIGLAHLARADGLLLLVAVLIFYLWQTPRLPKYYLPLVIAGYMLVMMPWFIRNWLLIGTPLSAAGSKTIWLTTSDNLFVSYSGLFGYNNELSATRFFEQGLAAILQGRWWVLVTNLQIMLAAWGMIFLTPLVLVGAWHLRHNPLIRLAGLYSLLIFAAMTVIFAFPGAMGGLFHSEAATLPFVYAVAVVGLDKAIDWIAARRRRWNAGLAKRVFGVGIVLMAVTLSGFVYYNRVLKNDNWNRADSLYPAVAQWVAQEGENGTVVMINNPPAYRYHGGGLSVVIPFENLDVILQVARRYGVGYLVIDSNHPPSLDEVYDNQTATHPSLSLVKTFGNKIYVFKISNKQ